MSTFSFRDALKIEGNANGGSLVFDLFGYPPGWRTGRTLALRNFLEWLRKPHVRIRFRLVDPALLTPANFVRLDNILWEARHILQTVNSALGIGKVVFEMAGFASPSKFLAICGFQDGIPNNKIAEADFEDACDFFGRSIGCMSVGLRNPLPGVNVPVGSWIVTYVLQSLYSSGVTSGGAEGGNQPSLVSLVTSMPGTIGLQFGAPCKDTKGSPFSDGAMGRALAHEIGHALGLPHPVLPPKELAENLMNIGSSAKTVKLNASQAKCLQASAAASCFPLMGTK